MGEWRKVVRHWLRNWTGLNRTSSSSTPNHFPPNAVLRSSFHSNKKQAHDELALLILAKHHLRPNPRSPMRPWTELCYVFRRTPERLQGGYFIVPHSDPERGYRLEAVPRVDKDEEDEDDDDDADTVTVTDYHGQSQNQHRAEREAGIEEVNELFAQLSVDVPKLRFLQTILRVLDVPTDEIPETITQCRIMLSTIHVVIWDIVGPLQEHAALVRDDGRKYNVRRYPINQIRDAVLAHRFGCFPRQRAKSENLRDLLRLLFGTRRPGNVSF